MKDVKRSALLATGAWAIVNMPLLIIAVEHFPNYDQTFLSLLFTEPGQYLFLFVFFPFIAFFVALATTMLRKFCEEHISRQNQPGYMIWRIFFAKRWAVLTLGFILGLIVATADHIETSVTLEELQLEYSRTAVKASDIILGAVKEESPEGIFRQLTDRKQSYPQLVLDLEKLRDILSEQIPRKGKNQRIISRAATQIGQALESQQNKEAADTYLTESAAKIESAHGTIGSDRHLFDALLYLQTVYNPIFSESKKVARTFSSAANFAELMIDVFVAWYILIGAIVLVGLRILVHERDEFQGELTRIALFLAFATFFFGLWPTFRIYSLQELRMIYPQARSTPPTLFYIFCIGVFSYLVVASFKTKILQIGTLATGLLVSVVPFVMSFRDVFRVREVVGSAIGIGNLIILLLVCLAVLGTLSFVLLVYLEKQE